MATVAGSLIEATADTSHSTEPTSITPTQNISTTGTSTEPCSEVTVISRPVDYLAFVKVAKADQLAPLLPALAAWTGQNFMFAARLSSVDKLNRPMRNIAVSRAELNTHQPAIVASKAVRRRTIKPPAVLRNRPRSAQIIPFQRAVARGQIQLRNAA
jgi:hypothetical protein